MSFVNKIKDKNGLEVDIQDKRIPEVLAENEGKILGIEDGAIVFKDAPIVSKYKYRHDLLLHFRTEDELYDRRNNYRNSPSLKQQVMQPANAYLQEHYGMSISDPYDSAFLFLTLSAEGRKILTKMWANDADYTFYDTYTMLYSWLQMMAMLQGSFMPSSVIGELPPYSIRAAVLSNDPAPITATSLFELKNNECEFVTAYGTPNDYVNMEAWDSYCASASSLGDLFNSFGSGLMFLPFIEQNPKTFTIKDISLVFGSGANLIMNYECTCPLGSGYDSGDLGKWKGTIFSGQIKQVDDTVTEIK